MKPEIRKVVSKTDLRYFIKLPWEIYKDDNCWVPPLIGDVKASLSPVKNPALNKIISEMYLAVRDGKPAGRIFAGIDTNLNKKKNMNMAFFSMFECINEYETAEALLNAAVDWARKNEADFMTGPCSVTGTDGDENKGLLVNCFDKPPVLMNSYNPPYYVDFIEKFGFVKDYDVFAYHLDKNTVFEKDPSKAIEYAQKRYNFRVDTLDTNRLDRDIKDLWHVMNKAMPDEWPDLVPPSLDEVRETAKRLLPLAIPELIPIARHGDEPIGFAISLPDYNQVLMHLNGKITPVGALKYLRYKRKIDCLRIFVMFVVPEFRSKGVSFAIYHTIFKNGLAMGYTWGEASTIGETNTRMRADIESAGGVHYKTYRIYRKEF